MHFLASVSDRGTRSSSVRRDYSGSSYETSMRTRRASGSYLPSTSVGQSSRNLQSYSSYSGGGGPSSYSYQVTRSSRGGGVPSSYSSQVTKSSYGSEYSSGGPSYTSRTVSSRAGGDSYITGFGGERIRISAGDGFDVQVGGGYSSSGAGDLQTEFGGDSG